MFNFKNKLVVGVVSSLLFSSSAMADKEFDYQEKFNDQTIGSMVKQISEMKELSESAEAFGVGFTIGYELHSASLFKRSLGKFLNVIPNSITFEVTHIKDGTYALYCAPGNAMSFGAGKSYGLSLINIYGCYENNDYTGNFLTIGAGPISHSWGASLDYFLSELEKKNKYGGFSPRLLYSELVKYIGMLKSRAYAQTVGYFSKNSSDRRDEILETDRKFLGMACNMVQMLSATNPDYQYPVGCKMLEGNNMAEFDLEMVSQYIGNPKEFAKKFSSAKDVASAFLENMKERGYENHFPNMHAFGEAWSGQFSGCNSWTYGIGVPSLRKLVKDVKRKGLGKAIKDISDPRGSWKDYLPYGSITHYAKVKEGKHIFTKEELKKLQSAFGELSSPVTQSLYGQTIASLFSDNDTEQESKETENFKFVKDLFKGCAESTVLLANDTIRAIDLFAVTPMKESNKIYVDEVNLDLE